MTQYLHYQLNELAGSQKNIVFCNALCIEWEMSIAFDAFVTLCQ